MKNKIFLIVIVLTPALLCSCFGKTPDDIVVSENEIIIGPGLTTELTVTPDVSENKDKQAEINYSSTALKSFTEKPEIDFDNSNFKILSVDPVVEKEKIYCKIILRASDSLLSGDTTLLEISWAGFKTETQLTIKKNPADYLDGNGVITDFTATDAMINKKRRLPSDYIPEDLVRVEVPTILVFEEVNHLRKIASDALSTMFRAAEEEQGFTLIARSGYRSYKTQVSLFDANVRVYGREYAEKFSAQPGTSEHQSGLAMDITAEVMDYQLDQSFGETAEGIWTAENAYRFGFIIRYPREKEDITGYSYEPWHLRYVGTKLAKEIYSTGLTLEEYYAGR